MNIQKIRGAVVLVLVVGVPLLGLATHTQLGALCSYGVNSISTICPLGALETLAGSKSPTMRALICLSIAIIVILLLGKVICAWACPVPWMQRFLSKRKKNEEQEAASLQETPSDEYDISASLKSPCASCASGEKAGNQCALKSVGGKRDGVRIDSRHAVLVGALASSAVFGFPVFCLICPVGLTFATIVGLWNLLAFNETTIGMVIFPIILIAELLLMRRWCHKICPISALCSLIANGNRTLRPRVDKTKCLREQGVDCHACVESCPEELDPHANRIPECSKCHKCADACPAHAIAFTKRKLTLSKRKEKSKKR